MHKLLDARLMLPTQSDRIFPWFFREHHALVTPDLAFNTAISFTTTTMWQAYPGEKTMSYFSQLVGLGVGNLLAGAAGRYVLVVPALCLAGLFAAQRRAPVTAAV